MRLVLPRTLALVAVLLPACSKDVLLLERTVTPIPIGGGTARSADGAAALTFPAGALSAPTDITIVTDRASRAASLRSFRYELGPDGATFSAPVTLVITADRADEELAIANLDGPQPVIVEGSTWDPATREVRAPLTHFSSYGAVVVYSPCGGLSCGDPCTLCDPTVTGCVEPAPTAKACNRSRLCVEASAALCAVDAGAPDSTPTDAIAPDVIEPDATTPDSGLGEGDGGTDAGDALPPDAFIPTSTCLQSFQQNVQPVLDILLVVDNSCSMAEEQAALAHSFGLLLDTLTGNNVDFHIGVTTTDLDAPSPAGQGRLAPGPRILTPTTPGLAATFAAHVQQGTNGSSVEQGLEAMRLALSPPVSTTTNAGFLRDHSGLTVIVLSDEPDRSGVAPATYVQFLHDLRDPGHVQFNAIVGDVPGGCQQPGTTAAEGLGYVDVRASTGGAFSSICDTSWVQALTDLGGPLAGYRQRYRLDQPLGGAGEILSVTVDGVLVPATGGGGMINWTYDPATQSILFTDDAVPPPGAAIVVSTVSC